MPRQSFFAALLRAAVSHYLEDRQEQAHEDGDDRDDDKKLDESKAARGERSLGDRFHKTTLF
jgi:hypothetical protein